MCTNILLINVIRIHSARPTHLPDYMNEMMSEQIYETMENYPDALINFGDGPVEIRVREAERRLDLKVSSRPVSFIHKITCLISAI